MELYNLAWTPSVTSTAVSQDVKALIAGVATDIALGLANTVPSVQFTFTTDAAVEWWVVTYNVDKSKSVESAHATFTAADQSPLAPATGLAETFVSHS